MKSVAWVFLGLVALAAMAWFFWPSLAPQIERAKGLEPVRVREINPMR